MVIKLLFFGITTDLVGSSSLDFEIPQATSVEKLKQLLTEEHPTLANINTYAIAVNEEYANDTLILKPNDIVAVIPPVSGG